MRADHCVGGRKQSGLEIALVDIAGLGALLEESVQVAEEGVVEQRALGFDLIPVLALVQLEIERDTDLAASPGRLR